jgi:ABC-2 type transport system permease protein
VSRRLRETVASSAAAAAAIFACTFATPSWDASENRANSLAEPDERALAQLHPRLRIEAHLAPEDPRRADLERKAIAKLRRVLPNVQVQYVSSTSIGLFEQTRPHYGEIWYELNGRREMSRATTAEGMLETIYDLAGVKPPSESEETVFRGHPLAVPPTGAGTVFYGIWPAVVIVSALFARRRPV